MLLSILLFVILQGLDILTTCIGGIQNEVNPVVRPLGAHCNEGVSMSPFYCSGCPVANSS